MKKNDLPSPYDIGFRELARLHRSEANIAAEEARKAEVDRILSRPVDPPQGCRTAHLTGRRSSVPITKGNLPTGTGRW